MSRGNLFGLTLSTDEGRATARASWQGRRAQGPLSDDFEPTGATLCPPGGAGSRAQDDPDLRVVRRLSPAATTRTVRQEGERLFACLPPSVRQLWGLARQRCAAAQERLHLHLSVDRQLADLPWELLCEPDGGAFVAASGETSMSRYVEPTRPVPPRRPDVASLYILVFVTSPGDLDPLSAADEIERIRKALPDRHVRIERVAGGERHDLIRSLEKSSPDVLHWIGHGVRDAEHGGRLVVESADGDSESISESMRPDQLAELLRGGPSLVVLATCHSAGSGSDDALAALAPGLARAGVPAVVAMRDAIRDQDALRFTQTLYSALAEGEDIATAVTLARRHLLLYEAGDSGAWAVPVLYQRDVHIELSSQRIPALRLRRRRLVGWTSFVAAVAAAGWLCFWIWSMLPGHESMPDDPVLEDPTAESRGLVSEFATIPEQAEPSFDRGHDLRCPAVAGLDLPLVYLDAGPFDMGSTDGKTDERPVHRVTLREPFCLGRFEVTVAQWNAVVPDDTREAADDLPVTHVSWNDAKRFVGELNRRAEGRPFRLPTEAEWEYAARAGTDTTWSFGDSAENLIDYGNCNPRQDTDGFDRTAPVGSLLPNPWGLFDMHGNVTEWVEDGYGPYSEDAATDPRGVKSSVDRVRRGGNFRTREENCSSSRRYASEADQRIYTTGFRLAAEPDL